MTNKHTPAPWQAENYEWDGDDLIRIQNASGASIAIVTNWEPSDEANARLIASAPEILEALIKTVSRLKITQDFIEQQIPVRDEYQSQKYARITDCIIDAQKIIAKAESK